jgi:hypothetical protein
MTFEHNIVVALEEIKAIIFECNTCKARTVLAPENIEVPPGSCPRGHGWDWNASTEHSSFGSPFASFIIALKRLRDPMSHRVGFRIYLEFDEPKGS